METLGVKGAVVLVCDSVLFFYTEEYLNWACAKTESLSNKIFQVHYEQFQLLLQSSSINKSKCTHWTWI